MVSDHVTKLTGRTYQTHFPGVDGQLEEPVDDIEGTEQEEYVEDNAEACDEAVKGKKQRAQKMMTCDLVDVAQNASLQQCPGNSTSVVPFPITIPKNAPTH